MHYTKHCNDLLGKWVCKTICIFLFLLIIIVIGCSNYIELFIKNVNNFLLLVQYLVTIVILDIIQLSRQASLLSSELCRISARATHQAQTIYVRPRKWNILEQSYYFFLLLFSKWDLKITKNGSKVKIDNVCLRI